MKHNPAMYSMFAFLYLPICLLANQAPRRVESDKIVPDKIAPDKIVSDKIVADKIVSDKIVPDMIVPGNIVPVSDKIMTAKIITDKIMSDKIVTEKMSVLRSLISEGADILRMNLVTPGFTLLVSAFSVWSILDLILKIVGLLTRTGSVKTNLLLILQEVFIGYVTNGIAGSFLGNLPPTKNPVLSALTTLTSPALATHRRRFVRELSVTANQAFYKYSALQH